MPLSFLFIFICILRFHDLYNVFYFVKIELQNSKAKAAIQNFAKKSCSTCMDSPIIEFVMT